MWFFHYHFRLSSRERAVLMAIVTILTFTSSSVQAAGAATLPTASAETNEVTLNDTASVGLTVPVSYEGALPDAKSVSAKRTAYVSMTAYTSSVDETDSTPFITADGSHTRDGIVAANNLKFGTRVRFPDLCGDKVFEVHDRMNKRYTDRIDIWMTTKGEAFKFGVKHNVRVEIL